MNIRNINLFKLTVLIILIIIAVLLMIMIIRHDKDESRKSIEATLNRSDLDSCLKQADDYQVKQTNAYTQTFLNGNVGVSLPMRQQIEDETKTKKDNCFKQFPVK